MNFRITLSAGIVSLAAITTALAHGGAMGVVKERMEAMGDMKDAVKTLTAIMRGQSDYDAAAVREQAGIIEKHGGEALTKLFPEGSSEPPSEAKPDIWSNWDAFQAQANRLETLASGLKAAAGNGLAAGNQGGASASSMMGTSGSGMTGGSSSMMSGGSMMGGSMGAADMPGEEELASMPANGVFNMLAQTCSSCHTRFRKETD